MTSKPTRDLRGARDARDEARKWFMAGFRASGKGMHGETVNLSRHGGVQTMLEAEFERQYTQRSKR